VNGTRLWFDVEVLRSCRGSTMREQPRVVLLHGGPAATTILFKPAFLR